MPEFEKLQKTLQGVRSALDANSREVLVGKEKLRALDEQRRAVSRRFDEKSQVAQALSQKRAQTERNLAGQFAESDKIRAEYGAAWEKFQPFTDPREHLERLSDAAPVLLFPVRLETRFKIVPGARVDRHQLWVRIFPDECSIDTFSDVLSASEVVRAQNYWMSVWAAGKPSGSATADFVRDKRLAAWRKLMGSFNAGRAHWVVEQYGPTNPEDMPSRGGFDDVLAIIATTDAPSVRVRAALSAFWTQVIQAGGAPEAVAAALSTLQTVTGLTAEEVQVLTQQHSPRDVEKLLAAGPPAGEVRVRFSIFPAEPDVTRSAWSRAARVRTFPERFVVLGYQEGAAEPVINALGAPIPHPVIVGPDNQPDIEALLVEQFGEEVAQLSDEEKATKYVEYLSKRSETSWLFDFDRAVEQGLGLRIELTPEQYNRGFSRLLAVGVQMTEDAGGGKQALEELLHHHQFGDAGFSLLPQGTPTNNTDDVGAGYSIREDAEEAHRRYREQGPASDDSEGATVDGRVLAEALGLDPEFAGLRTARHYDLTDQADARAMQTALWNATLGYFLESSVPAVASESARLVVRSHFLENVRGRGSLPSLRIGKQPYGVLPIADLSRFRLGVGVSGHISHASVQKPSTVLPRLFAAAMTARADLQEVLAGVAHIGDGDDPHATLLRVLGLHPTSVEYDRRIAESFTAASNALLAQGIVGLPVSVIRDLYRKSGVELLERLGYRAEEGEQPSLPILDRAFLGNEEDVEKPAIEDAPLSEHRGLAATTNDGKNYIEWLVEGAKEDQKKLVSVSGFQPGKAPSSILFDLLRHSLNLGFGEAGLRLLQKAEFVDQREVRALRLDPEFIGIDKQKSTLESKWDLIDRVEPAIAQDKTIAQHISTLLKGAVGDDSILHLAELTESLERLAGLPTAHLERCMAEHLDLCHYRLDAWLLSFVSAQLKSMRRAPNGPDGGPATGVYLGAYGWVENLTPQERKLTPVALNEEQRAVFDPDDRGDLVRDSENAGHIHAPSIPHATTASVLRNAYISSSNASDAARYSVNLSSERVRLALQIVEGMQQGQGLAELLGYQLERGLHDHNEEELDVFVYELRKVFPLASNRLASTKIRKGRTPKNAREAERFAEEEKELDGSQAVTKIEARNVVDGVALVEHTSQPGKESYPFGFPTGSGLGELREASDDERAAIDAEVERLKNIRDAVADLGLAESVHQSVQGNFDRAAGALDAFSKGAFPQTPDVIQSPASGRGLTQRFGIHFPAGVSPDSGTTPRSKAEPALNAWLKGLFPTPDSVACTVRFEPTGSSALSADWLSFVVTLQDLGMEPIDVLFLHEGANATDFSALDDAVLRVFRSHAPRRLDLQVRIEYVDAPGGNFSFFQLGALLSHLRKLVVAARPLEASDLTLQKEGTKQRNASAVLSLDRISKPRALLDTFAAALQSDLIAPVAPLFDLEDPSVGAGNFPAVLAAIDAVVVQFSERVGALRGFGFEGADSAFLTERLRAIHGKVTTLVRRHTQSTEGEGPRRQESWQARSERYQSLVDTQLPLAMNEEEKIKVWHEAERAVSVTFTTEFAHSDALAAAVGVKRTLFEAKRTAADALGTTEFTSVAALFAAADALRAGTETIDSEPLDLNEARQMVVILVEDLLRQALKLHARAVSASAAAGALIGEAAANPGKAVKRLTEAAQSLFGEGFRVYPEFTLPGDQAQEFERCLDDGAQLLKYQVEVMKTDDPTEDWLISLARVREKLTAWEATLTLAEVFRGGPPLGLVPVQLPYREGDSWLALGYPPDHVIEGDNLLYTAHAPGLDPTQPLVGALVDEWTETLPSESATTALSFHYDRPNCEPPQSLLLVTPASVSGAWQWEELVGALHEGLDLARLRALEPDLLDQTNYAKFLPATTAALTFHPVTIAVNFALQGFAPEVSIDG